MNKTYHTPYFIPHTSDSRGFTLVEMLVVIFIITVISAVALINGRQFDSSVFLTDTAYEISLAVREAQSYGINVRGEGVEAAAFETGYGIYLDKDTPAEIKLFADKFPALAKKGSGKYEALSDGSIIKTYGLKKGLTVSNFCALRDRVNKCSSGGSDVLKLFIVFTRPNPEPTIKSSPAGACGDEGCERAEIFISSPSNQQRKIIVYNTGQISVE